jgi:signal transduction histidine kinase
MANNERKIQTGSNADIAFAIVVLASYFATFSSIRQTGLLDILILVVIGIGYVLFGIYGYAYIIRTNLLAAKGIYFIIQIILGSLIVSLGKGAGYNALIFMPLAGQAVVSLPEIWAYLSNLAICGAYILSISSYSHTWGEVWAGLPTFFAGLIFIVVFTQVAVGEQAARKEVERLLAELRDANQQLKDYSEQVEELAVIEERNRMAREIHDGLGHYLTTIHMQIQAAEAVMDRKPERSREMLEKAASLTVEALGDVRTSVASLRSSVQNQPLETVIKKLVADCTSLKIDFLILGKPVQLAPQLRLTVFRTAQEAINNVQKHSRATSAQVKLDYSQADRIKLSVEDNGVGTDQPQGGYGLLGLAERARLLNGTLTIQTAQGTGFMLKLELPYG